MFNIGAVSRMTNIPEATLRVWERRYGFPKPTRTSGGHRLYSQQEVFRLQWVKTRIDEGMQVSKAIRALERAEQDGTFVPAPTGIAAAARPLSGGASLNELQSRLFEALSSHNGEEASLVIGEAQMLYPLEEITLSLIGPTLNQIGEAWAEGKVDVATEHFATNYLRHYLWVWMRVGPPTFDTNPVVLACAPGELHEGSLLMLGVLLRRLRWPVLYLGQTMPLRDLDMLLEDLSPPVVVFVAMLEESARALAEWPRCLPAVAESGKPLIAFGGLAFSEHPEWIEQVQGTYLGETLREGVQTLNTLLLQMNPLLSV